MTKETVKDLQDAKGKFELEINGLGVRFTVDHCNGAAWLIAIQSMVDKLSETTGVPYKTILGMVEKLADNAHVFKCESKEQLDVMNEIYRQQLEK